MIIVIHGRPHLAIILPLLLWSNLSVALLLTKSRSDRRITTSASAAAAAALHQSPNDDSRDETTPLPARHPKAAQIRQKPQNSRKPRRYWLNVSNVEREIRELWESVNVTTTAIGSKSNDNSPAPLWIPNESLLNYWGRHDLRGAIATHGGREFLAETLGEEGASIIVIPGKWSLAVKKKQVQELLRQDSNLSPEFPPSFENKSSRWFHQRNDRKPNGYWNSVTVVIKELYEYLQERRKRDNIPEGWMPRMSDVIHAGRDDLVLAINRHGGQKVICKRAGLVPFREWNYIEGMHELLLGLQDYLDQYYGGDYSTFPIASRIREMQQHQPYDRLYSLIQYYGGSRFLAARLDMDFIAGGKRTRRRTPTTSASSSTTNNGNHPRASADDMNWGPFDLEFGIELYACVRQQHMKMKPPLRYPEIRMPSQSYLLESDKGLWLDKKIQEYGGYENVARRLGLAFPFSGS